MSRFASVTILCGLTLSAMLSPTLCIAQATLGAPNFSAFDSHPYDSVDLMSNTVVLNIPVMRKVGSYPFSLSLVANSAMTTRNLSGTTTWMPTMYDETYYTPPNGSSNPFPGFPFVRSFSGIGSDSIGIEAYPTSIVSSTCAPNAFHLSGFVLVTPDGTTHYIGSGVDTPSGGTCNPYMKAQAQDASGLTLEIYEGQYTNVYRRDGSVFPAQSLTTTDRNGNTISETANFPASGSGSASWTDSMGQTVLSYSYTGTKPGTGGTYSWTDVNSGSPLITQNQTSTKLQTNFGCGTGHPADLIYGSTQYYLTTAFAFADGTSLGISYEPTPGHSGDYTGRLKTLN